MEKYLYELYDENGKTVGKSYSTREKMYKEGYFSFNGIGKLYIDNEITLEGQFVNGILNGQGKTYINGELSQEGTFRNGSLIILCELYDMKNELIQNISMAEDDFYESGFRDYNGQGRICVNGKIYKEGLLENGKLNGFGRKYSLDGLSEEGEFKNDKLNGYGRIYLNGEIYEEGEFEEGSILVNCQLRDKNGNIIYEEKITENKFYSEGFYGYSGYGRLYINKILKEEGQFYNGKLNGQGRIYLEGVLFQEGQFKNGKINGEGKTYRYGVIHEEGIFVDNVLCGEGKEYIQGRLYREGNFVLGELNGLGRTYVNGKLFQYGKFKNGIQRTGV